MGTKVLYHVDMVLDDKMMLFMLFMKIHCLGLFSRTVLNIEGIASGFWREGITAYECTSHPSDMKP
jgi:hypothetical protein